MNIVTIPIGNVDVGERLRNVDEDWAALIAASMKVDGQRTPIEVRAPDADGRYRLIAGGHRVRAAQIAGLAVLEAVIKDVGDLDAERLEIEENLCRRDLTELDRATFLTRWKAVYEALNVRAGHGKASKKKDRKFAILTDAEVSAPFSEVAADRLGLSKSMIQRATARYRHIAPDVRSRIAGTWLASHGAQLDLLARFAPEVQRKVVALMLERGATSLTPLHNEVMGFREAVVDADQAQYDALAKAWRKAGKVARNRFIADMVEGT